jgi:hypothetical protein
MRRTAGYNFTSLGYGRNLDMMKELNTESIMEFVENYKSNCKKHILGMFRSRIPFQCQPRGRRSLGRHYKSSRDIVTGHKA